MYTREEYNEIKDTLKEKEQEDKIRQIEKENNTTYILQHQMKIISINIGEDIRNKIKLIKEFLKKQSPDIMCIMETHTYYEDYSKIKGWLENKDYKVLYTAKSQKEYYDSIKDQKIKEIQNNIRMTERDKEININKWKANTMLNSIKYAG